MSQVRSILTIVGARPQFIKAAPVSKALCSAGLHEVLLHTGQHYDSQMSARFFEELGLPEPRYNLGIGSGSHGAQTARMLRAIEEVLLQEKPDWVLVFGDTNSTLAGALAAAKLGHQVAHVESGLRSYNREMPEEINRIAADRLSALLFAPTAQAVQALKSEGFDDGAVVLTGDVMYDAALMFAEKAIRASDVLQNLGLKEKEFILATLHRAENTDTPERLSAILGGLTAVSNEIPVIMPLHPRTRKQLAVSAINTGPIRLCDPVGYLDMLNLTRAAKLVVTDSGGLQKEAYFQKVPCVTLREETEWRELVDAGWNRLVPPMDKKGVRDAILAELHRSHSQSAPQFYGDGSAAKLIAERLAASRD